MAPFNMFGSAVGGATGGLRPLSALGAGTLGAPVPQLAPAPDPALMAHLQTLGPAADLNPLAAQTGIARDQLAAWRDGVFQQREDAFRAANPGMKIAADGLGAYAQMQAQQGQQLGAP